MCYKGACLGSLDLLAAFDAIDYDKRLTYVMDYSGFDDNALKFMKSYLWD